MNAVLEKAYVKHCVCGVVRGTTHGTERSVLRIVSRMAHGCPLAFVGHKVRR